MILSSRCRVRNAGTKDMLDIIDIDTIRIFGEYLSTKMSLRKTG